MRLSISQSIFTPPPVPFLAVPARHLHTRRVKHMQIFAAATTDIHKDLRAPAGPLNQPLDFYGPSEKKKKNQANTPLASSGCVFATPPPGGLSRVKSSGIALARMPSPSGSAGVLLLRFLSLFSFLFFPPWWALMGRLLLYGRLTLFNLSRRD